MPVLSLDSFWDWLGLGGSVGSLLALTVGLAIVYCLYKGRQAKKGVRGIPRLDQEMMQMIPPACNHVPPAR